MSDKTGLVIYSGQVESRILLIRGQKIIIDSDLAQLYGVETKMLIRAMKRNINRFPRDFAFQLNKDEFNNLKFHFGTSSWGGRRYLPYAFTEHGVIMAAGVLNSQRAVQASIYVVRAFIKLRQLLSTHKELAVKLQELERKLQGHDEQIQLLIEAIRQLMLPLAETKTKQPFGFHVKKKK